MPTIKTIKASGGDYTSLQAWEDFADGEASADQWAECYDGVNLAKCLISGWTSTPSASLYPRIYTPIAERHTGKDDSTGAYIDLDNGSNPYAIQVQEEYVRIEGIKILMDGNSTAGKAIDIQANNCRVDSCLFESEKTDGYGSGVYVMNTASVSWNVDIWNNLMYWKGHGASSAGPNQAGIYIYAQATFGSTPTIDAKIYNNTIHDFDVGSGSGYGIRLDETTVISGTPTIDATVKNNIITDAVNGDYNRSGSNGTVTGEYNASSDATGDDWGATGALINQTASDLYVNTSTDLSLKPTSNALNAGDTIADFDTDAIHEDSDNWRPQGSSWDMGALELVQSSFKPRVIIY